MNDADNNTGNKVASGGRWYRTRAGKLGLVLAAIVAFLLVLPELLRIALMQFLPDTGIGDVAISDVDFNLFDASAGIEELVITREGETQLTLKDSRVDVSWLKLMLGQIYVERLVVDGVRFSAKQGQDGQWQVVIPLPGGEPSTEAEPADEPGSSGLPKVVVRAVVIRDVAVAVDSPTVAGTFGIEELELQHISTWQEEPADLTLQAHWQQALVTLKLTAEPWIATPRVTGQLQIERAPLRGIRPPLGDEALFGDIGADLAFNLEQTGEEITGSAAGSLVLEDFAYEYEGLALKQEGFSWEGDVALAIPADPQQSPSFRIDGDWRSQGLDLHDQRQDVQLLYWDSLQVDSLALDQALNLTMEQLTLTAVEALKSGDHESPLRTGEFTLSQLALEEGRRLSLERAAIGDAVYNLVITEEGELQFQSVLTTVMQRFEEEPATTATSPATDSADSETAGASPPFQFSVGTLQVRENTRITLVDRRFDTPVEQTLNIQALTVRHLSQAQPQQDTEVSLQAAVGEFGSLQAEGVARPFAEDLFVDISGELHAIELPDISPYSEAYLGYELTQGHYDHSFAINIADGEIDLVNTLKLRQLALQSVNPDKPQPVEKQLDLPLGLALDMLRDSDDNIELEVPIQGRLDDPDINVSDVVNRALAKALRSGTTSYLKFALQPYGAILMAADFVGEQASAVRLEPMIFAPGSEAVPEDRGYVDKLEGLLLERPQLSLSLCGRSSLADFTALYGGDEQNPEGAAETAQAEQQTSEQRAALVKLAERRGANLKRVFIERGIGSGRLLLCQPDYQPEGISGVKLGM